MSHSIWIDERPDRYVPVPTGDAKQDEINSLIAELDVLIPDGVRDE